MDIIDTKAENKLVADIRELLTTARNHVAIQVNNVLLNTYFEIGKLIVEHEQGGESKAKYGTKLIDSLSKKLTAEFGKGFSRSNLKNMRSFYNYKQKSQTLSGELSWSHYCELLIVSDPDARNFYENQAINERWSVRVLKRQIDSALFERLLLTKGADNQKKMLELTQKGVVPNNIQDTIKDPYVFEFLGLPEKTKIRESKLEKKLIEYMKDFLLELGTGFSYVGNQQRITLNNTHYYVDLVFYNKIARAYLLVDLKTGRFKPENIGQMNMYLNYYKTEINADDDNPPYGLIICADKDDIAVEYATAGLSNIGASKYSFVLPDKDKLIDELSKQIKN